MRFLTHNVLAACRFLRAHAPGLTHGPVKGLARWLSWYWSDARVGVVLDRGRIVAIGLARALDVPEQARDVYFHKEAGRLVWVQDLVSLHPLGLPLLLQHTAERFGPREGFCGAVFFRDGELRMLPWRTVERLIDGATASPHGLTLNSRRTRGA